MKKYLMYGLIASIGIIFGLYAGINEIFPYRLLDFVESSIYKNENPEKHQVKNIFPKIDLTDLISTSPDNIDSIREILNYSIFGSHNLPVSIPDTVYKITDTAYDEVKNLESIEQFEITQEYNIKSIGYIFHPKEANKQLMLYHQGHRGDFLKGKETLQYFIEKGYTVYAFCMPLLGKNNQPVITKSKFGAIHLNSHERLKYLEYPIQYFINPIVTMINYGQCEDFENISMIGISGGGWTTTLAAAVDNRISYSFPVAGTYPMYIRFQTDSKNYGDMEQSYVPLYSKVNYLDMYVLGSVGENRFQVQILNKYDPCCFDGEEYLKYESFISEYVQTFENGSFKAVLDTTHNEHKISDLALNLIYNRLKSAYY